MSILTSQILDPIYHSNSRTEFKIFGRDRIYTSKMRVCSFGCSEVTPAGDTNYNIEGGVYALLKQASLYFNDVLVDQVKDASKVLSIQNNVMNTYDASNIAKDKKCSNIAYEWNPANPQQLDLENFNDKLLGHINLDDVFPVLRVSAFLPNIYEIRVVFEYETDPNKIFIYVQPDSFKVSEPKIIVDEVMDRDSDTVKMLSAPLTLANIPCIITERVIVSSSTSPQTIRLRAFDGMNLLRLVANAVIGNQTSDAEALIFSRSDVIEDEKINFIVNNVKLLQFNGMDHPQKKIYMSSESMGDFLCPFGGADLNLVDDPLTTFDEVYTDSLTASLVGKLSYTAVDINRKINRLEFEVSKSETNTIYYYFFGVVFKYLIKKGDVVETGYM